MAPLCLTLCDTIVCNTPGFLAHHQLLELLKLMSVESMMPSIHLILCCSLLPPPSMCPSIRVFSNVSVLPIRWPKYWSFSISPSSEYSGLICFRMDGWISVVSKELTRVFPNTTVQKHPFAGFLYRSTLTSIHAYWKNHSYD